MVNLTASAADAVRRFINNSDKEIVGLRIRIDGGGCSGYQYGMRLEGEIADSDLVHECSGITMLIDRESQHLLNGVTVDFIDTMEGSGFKFENPNAMGSCSCGKSFSC